MGIMPNIQALELNGKDLIVRGETDDLPVAIFVVVSQDAVAGAAPASATGIADRVGSGWRAKLTDTTFHKGAAQAMGVQIHTTPFASTSWVQTVTIV